MWFAVLGQVSVGPSAERPVLPPSLRQRQLLAILICRAGHAMSADALIDAIWTGSTPASAAKNLRTYIHRLRRLVGPDRIEFGPGGYSLVAEPDEVDAGRFAALADEGGAAMATGDLGAADAAFQAALDLWRGEPYDGLADPAGRRPEPVELEAARLTEARLQLLEDQAEVRLALGGHATLVATLTKLSAEHPLRERIRGALMLALHRCGRTAEALQVYRDARERLIDDLGIEPGRDLRELETRILAEDPALALDPSSEPAAGDRSDRDQAEPDRVIPAELPAPVLGFVGRKLEAKHLADRLLEPPRSSRLGPVVVALSGPGGVGKSSLAIQVGNTIADRFPDGQLYVNLHGATPDTTPLRPAEALQRFLRSVGLGEAEIPRDADEAASRFRSATAGRRLLIVLDDAAGVDQVRPLLPGTADTAVIITSRGTLTELTGADHHVALDTLDPAEATALMVQLLGRERATGDPSAVAKIIDSCGGLPLAVRIAGARLAARPDWSVASFAGRLADARDRLDELAYGDLAVRASCQISADALDESESWLFKLLGLLDQPTVSVSVAAALIDRDPAEARRLLDRLVDAQLLRPDHDHYSFHDLVRLYAGELATLIISADARAAALRRVVHHYLATFRQLLPQTVAMPESRLAVGPARLLVSGDSIDDLSAGRRWLRTEADNLLPLLRQAAGLDAEGRSAAIALAISAFPGLTDQGALTTVHAVTQQALSIADDHDLAAVDDPRRIRALLLRDLGVTWKALWELDLAAEYLERAEVEAVASADPHLLGDVRNSFGTVRGYQRRTADAIDLYQQARQHFRDADSWYGEAMCLSNLAPARYDQGETEAARNLLFECLAIHEDLGESNAMAITLTNLSVADRELGDLPRARSVTERALAIHRRLGNRRGEASATWHLGQVLALMHDQVAATRHWQHALDQFVAMGAISGEEADRILADPEPELPRRLFQA